MLLTFLNFLGKGAFSVTQNVKALSAGALEYTDHISSEG